MLKNTFFDFSDLKVKFQHENSKFKLEEFAEDFRFINAQLEIIRRAASYESRGGKDECYLYAVVQAQKTLERFLQQAGFGTFIDSSFKFYNSVGD